MRSGRAASVYTGDLGAFRADVEAAERGKPAPLPRFAEIARFALDSGNVTTDGARWLLARAAPRDGAPRGGSAEFATVLRLVLAADPGDLGAWGDAIRAVGAAGVGQLIKESRASPRAAAILALLGDVGPARRELARIAATAGIHLYHPDMCFRLAARMSVVQILDSAPCCVSIAAVATGGSGAARASFGEWDSPTAADIVRKMRRYLKTWLTRQTPKKNQPARVRARAIPGVDPLADDLPAREFLRRRARAARARQVEYDAWRAAAAAACAALGRRSAGALAAADKRYRRSLRG